MIKIQFNYSDNGVSSIIDSKYKFLFQAKVNVTEDEESGSGIRQLLNNNALHNSFTGTMQSIEDIENKSGNKYLLTGKTGISGTGIQNWMTSTLLATSNVIKVEDESSSAKLERADLLYFRFIRANRAISYGIFKIKTSFPIKPEEYCGKAGGVQIGIANISKNKKVIFGINLYGLITNVKLEQRAKLTDPYIWTFEFTSIGEIRLNDRKMYMAARGQLMGPFSPTGNSTLKANKRRNYTEKGYWGSIANDFYDVILKKMSEKEHIIVRLPNRFVPCTKHLHNNKLSLDICNNYVLDGIPYIDYIRRPMGCDLDFISSFSEFVDSKPYISSTLSYLNYNAAFDWNNAAKKLKNNCGGGEGGYSVNSVGHIKSKYSELNFLGSQRSSIVPSLICTIDNSEDPNAKSYKKTDYWLRATSSPDIFKKFNKIVYDFYVFEQSLSGGCCSIWMNIPGQEEKQLISGYALEFNLAEQANSGSTYIMLNLFGYNPTDLMRKNMLKARLGEVKSDDNGGDGDGVADNKSAATRYVKERINRLPTTVNEQPGALTDFKNEDEESNSLLASSIDDKNKIATKKLDDINKKYESIKEQQDDEDNEINTNKPRYENKSDDNVAHEEDIEENIEGESKLQNKSDVSSVALPREEERLSPLQNELKNFEEMDMDEEKVEDEIPKNISAFDENDKLQ